jgi:hypothetical protein
MSELHCGHGIGHSAGNHTCDGCCNEILNSMRQHVIGLISVLDSHTTHSERCLRQHWLAERLTTHLQRETNDTE